LKKTPQVIRTLPRAPFSFPADLDNILKASAENHHHLCPRQVLGARVGLAGISRFDSKILSQDKRLIVFVETDGCFISGLQAAAGVGVNRRTLRIMDYGKIAATFVDSKTERAVRIAPQKNIRSLAADHAQPESKRYFAMLEGYQRMPEDELLSIQSVKLTINLKEWISRPGVKQICSDCGEEIINEREVIINNETYCIACANGAYYE
jgi:formylmethanofuran dehydrogenase subunit E